MRSSPQQRVIVFLGNPFDEPLEHHWIEQWLFFANAVRYGAAMGGPDLQAFKYGWWELNKNLREMNKRK